MDEVMDRKFYINRISVIKQVKPVRTGINFLYARDDDGSIKYVFDGYAQCLVTDTLFQDISFSIEVLQPYSMKEDEVVEEVFRSFYSKQSIFKAITNATKAISNPFRTWE